GGAAGRADGVGGVGREGEHDGLVAFDGGIIHRRHGQEGGSEERGVGDRGGQRLVIRSVLSGAAEQEVDRQGRGGAAGGADGEVARVATVRGVCMGGNGRHGGQLRGRLAVVRDHDGGAAGRADGVGGVGREGEHDRLVAFDGGIIHRRHGQEGGTGAGENCDRGDRKRRRVGKVSGAAEHKVDGQIRGGAAGAADGEG